MEQIARPVLLAETWKEKQCSNSTSMYRATLARLFTKCKEGSHMFPVENVDNELIIGTEL